VRQLLSGGPDKGPAGWEPARGMGVFWFRMKTRSLALGAAVAVALAATPLRAQDEGEATSTAAPAASAANDSAAPSPAETGGTLGRTYLSVDTSLLHFSDVAGSPNGVGADFGANIPMGDHFDYSLGYAFEDSRSHDFNLTDNSFSNSVKSYYKFGHVSPYATLGVGYEWERVTSGTTVLSLPDRFDRLDYDVGAGLEFPLTSEASLRAGIGDDDSSLRRPRARDWDYDLSANYWLGSVVGTFVGAEVRNGRGGALNATEFTIGLRFLLSSD
jgi:outer membrane protein with beta-barrel domain